MPAKIEYRYVDQDHGGTFCVDEQSVKEDERIPYIGTYDLVNCVGVYLPIDARRCFVAHIDAYVGIGGGEVAHNDPAAIQIEEIVLERLTAHSKANNWEAEDVIDCLKTPNGPKPILASPHLGKGGAAYAVLKAIQRFLGSDTDLTKFKYQGLTGFVVNHKSGELDRFGFGRDFGNREWQREGSKFSRVKAIGQTRDWEVSVER